MISRTKPCPNTLCSNTRRTSHVAGGECLFLSEPALIQPLMDAFTAETGVAVNVAFLKKGMIERLRAEGSRSPADLVFTVDISRLHGVVDAGLTQPVQNEVLTKNIPAEFRDPRQSLVWSHHAGPYSLCLQRPCRPQRGYYL